MTGGVYFISFTGQAETVAVDFFEILCPTDAVMELLRVDIGQDTEAGDAAAELLAWRIVRGEGTVTSGSGGVTPDSEPAHTGAGASGLTVEATNTTKMAAGTGTLNNMYQSTFHVAAGLHWEPVSEHDRIFVSPGDRITVELINAPADSITWSGTAVVKLYGG